MILLHRAPSGSKAGLTLLEAVVFMTLIVMAMGALSYTSLTVAQLQRAEQERGQASQALISVVEDVRRTARELVEDPLGWAPAFSAAYSPGGTPGDQFDVAGLESAPGIPAQCTVTVITDETLDDAALGVQLGMPMDLNNDGAANNANVSASAQLLPVIVRVRWQGPLGARELNQGLLLLGI